jgi:hypothetical protein
VEQIEAIEDLLSEFEDTFSRELTPDKFMKSEPMKITLKLNYVPF